MDTPLIKYARTDDGVNIAYSVTGSGPALLMSVPPMGGHLEYDWQFPALRTFYEHLAQFMTLVRFDHRGGGLSDHAAERYSTAHFTLDIAAVERVVQADQWILWGSGRSATTVIHYVQQQQSSRISKLILWMPLINSEAHIHSARTRALHSAEELDPEVANVARAALLAGRDHGASIDDLVEFIGRIRAAADPLVIKASKTFSIDTALEQCRIPTLILTRRELRYNNESTARSVAAALPDAQLAVLSGQSALPYLGDHREIVDRVVVFITGALPQRVADKSGASVQFIVFTDIENSTALITRLGDTEARDLLRVHDTIIRRIVSAFQGTEIKSMGDGFMLSFGSASHALDAGIAMQRELAQGFGQSPLPIAIRIGIHAGEPISEQHDLHGRAVVQAARIMAQARGGQILISDVVRQLAAGKHYPLSDQGLVELKGLEEPHRLFAVNWTLKS